MLKRFGVQLGSASYPCTLVSEKGLVDFIDGLDLRGKEISVDIETYPNPRFSYRKDAGLLARISLIRLVQIFDGKEIIIFDLMAKGGQLNFVELGKEMFEKFYEKVLLAPAKLYAHNALFETQHFQKYAYDYGIRKPLDIHCSMQAYLLYLHAIHASDNPNDFKANLEVVSKNILGLTLDKEEQTSRWGAPELTDSQLLYAARDACCPMLIHQALQPYLAELQLMDVHDLNRNAQEVVAAMNYRGICFDMEKHQELIGKWEADEKEQRDICNGLLNRHLLEMTPQTLLDRISVGLTPETVALLPTFQENEREKWLEQLFELQAEADRLREENKETKGAPRKAKSQLKKISDNIKNLIIKLDSTKDLGIWLEQNLSFEDLEKWPRTPSGKGLKTDAEAFMDAQHLEIVKPIVAYRKHSKLVSTYGASLQEFAVPHPDGSYRIHSNYTLCKTETGRMSSYEPNLQNIPARKAGKVVRSIFVPAPGERVFITADYNQIELRVAAYLSGDPVLLNAYETGLDIHRLTASRILQKGYDDVTDEERSNAKAPNFLLIYGGGPTALKKGAKRDYGVEMSDDYAEFVVNGFRQAYPGLRQWQLDTTQRAERDLYSTTALGKLRRLHKDWFYTVGLNHPVQGGAAELMLLAALFIHERFIDQQVDSHLVGIVHDEMDVDCLTKDEEAAKSILKTSMQDAMSIVFPGATHNNLVSIKSGMNWLEAK